MGTVSNQTLRLCSMCRDDSVCAGDEWRRRQLGGDPGIASLDGTTLGAWPPRFRATRTAAKGLGIRGARYRARRWRCDLERGRGLRLVRH